MNKETIASRANNNKLGMLDEKKDLYRRLNNVQV